MLYLCYNLIGDNMFRYDEKKKLTNENPLFRKQESVLNVNSKSLSQSNSKPLMQKQKLMVFTKDDSFYITKEAAYALGLTSTRAIMTSKDNNLFQISERQLNNIKQRPNIEIEYTTLTDELSYMIPEKPKIQIFYNEKDQPCISMSAAYSLGLVDDKTFYQADSSSVYVVGENMMAFLKNKYDLEFGENYSK